MNLSWLLPSVKGIPVLMYHKVWPGINDALTITPEKLREQWAYLKQEGYQTLALGQYLEIINSKKPVYPAKSILITFDDGYRNNSEWAYPLLQEMGWQATFFIIGDTLVPGTPATANTPDAKMGIEELQKLDPATVQLALHGYHHEHFKELSFEEIKKVMEQTIEAFDNSGLAYHKALAYPYGSRPKDHYINTSMKNWMQSIGIQAAFRIGNQVGRIPTPDKYELKRIDIKGSDTMEEFKIKLVKGKLKPF